MLTDLQRDILVKAAEGIQEGMSCRGSWFKDDEGGAVSVGVADVFVSRSSFDLALAANRCPEGEIALRAVQLGGNLHDWQSAVDAVADFLDDHEHFLPSSRTLMAIVPGHNDNCLRDLDAFSAGQEWARIFRQVAER